jgi:small subunit ribosomal protein S29
MLGQVAKANNEVLSKFELSKEHKDLPIPIPKKTSLARLAELGARDPDIAWPMFQAFWSEITAPGRPPILFALDGLARIMKNSEYRNPDFELIHAHDFAIIKVFVDHLSGSSQLPNGGSIFAACTKSNEVVSKATNLAIQQQVERQSGQEISKSDPFTEYDMVAHKSLQAASVLKLGGLSKVEARGLMEYWAASGVLRQRVDERTVAEKWTLAGSGIVGEIERGALRMRI